jgi:ABC-type multidrug transport system fused ATPase/permease subunit
MWAILKPAQRRAAFVLLAWMVVGMVMETLGVGLVIPAMALFTQADIGSRYPALRPLLESLGHPSRGALLAGGMAVLALAYLLKGLVLGFLAHRQNRFAFGVQAELSERLFSLYLGQPYTFHLERNSAILIRNAIGEINILTFNGMLPALLLLTESLVLVALVVILFVVEPVGAAVVIGTTGGLTAIFHRLTRSSLTRWGEARQRHEGLRMQHLQQGLGGVKDVKLLGREDDFLSQYQYHNLSSTRAMQFQTTLVQLPRLWFEFLAVAALAMLVTLMLQRGRSMEEILPVLGVFAAVAFRLMPSANRLLGAVQSLRYALPVVDVLYRETRLPAPGPRARTMAAIPFGRVLDLSDVSFTYPGAATASLRGVSVRVQRGESVGFVGSSGAGKSTLVDVLLGLLTPDAGVVAVDGVGIQTNLRGWQDQIGYVPQSIFLTDDSLRRNVAFGLPDSEIDANAVRRALRAAQLDEFIATLPEGLETVVGERGVRLSGGQRQRIGIARALYHDPTVLVLDEATSALDTATEHEVMEAVRALHGTKTIVIVAHRLSTVEHCDRVYRLKDGCVVEEGTPATVVLGQPRGAA